MARPLVLAWLAAASGALCACGGATGGASGTGGPEAASGRALFAQACGACHTLTGHNDARHQGGDLLGFHATHTQLNQLASEMPVRHPLSRGQLQAVVHYVMSMEAGRS
jgi:mono/diheme cytochrome c family protein